MSSKNENGIMEAFILKSAQRPEVGASTRAALGVAPVSAKDEGVAHGLAVAARILAEILWPNLTPKELAFRIDAIGRGMTGHSHRGGSTC